MKAWEIDDPTAYKYVRGLQKAIRTYFETRNDTLSNIDDKQTIIEKCENLYAWQAITNIIHGDIDIEIQEDYYTPHF